MAEVRSQSARRELRFRSTNQLKEVKEFKDVTVIRKGETTKVSNNMRKLAGEMILGYIWWSLFHGIAPMIWFYPLNQLEISGYEIYVVAILSPALTSVFAFLKFSTSIPGLFLWRTLSFVGVASFQASTTLIRLSMLAFGCGAAMLWFCGMIWSKDARERVISFWGLILGFFLMLILRIPYVSVNPIWSDSTSNLVILVIGIIALLDRLHTCYSNCGPQTAHHSKSSHESQDSRVSGPGWFLVALGFGAFMFLIHDVFGEASLVCRWAVSGYPQTGPKPNPWGAVVIVALAAGVLLSPYNWTSRWFWWLIGSTGAALLYFAPRYWSLAGGLILGVYIMSIWPAMIDRLFCRPVACTLTLANVIYIVLTLGSVWVVAFNFVPGGVYMRERTHVLLAIAMTFIGLALLTNKTPEENENFGKDSDDKKHNDSGSVQNPDVSVCGYNNVAFLKENGDESGFFRTNVIPTLVFLVSVGIILMGIRYHKLDYSPPHKEDAAVFSAMVWNLHFAYDNEGWPSFEAAAQMFNGSGADIVGLMESDCSKPFLGNHDLAMWFEERLGMYSDFGPATKDHTWGATLLSKYPIVKSLHHLLPSPEGEVAPALSATINITGNLVDVVVVHMGNDRDNLDRKLQAQELATILDKSSNPIVLLGYVTSAPGSRDYKVLTRKGRTKDIDDTDSQRWCLYIMYRGLVRLGYARISHGGLSDTEVQMGKFRIPSQGANYQDNDIMTTNPNDVPDSIRFTERFGFHYVGHYYPPKHHYHMSTPKYFLRKNSGGGAK